VAAVVAVGVRRVRLRSHRELPSLVPGAGKEQIFYPATIYAPYAIGASHGLTSQKVL
jgi:hypothetical protein